MTVLCAASIVAAAGLASTPPQAIHSTIQGEPTWYVPGTSQGYTFESFDRPISSKDGSRWVMRSGVNYVQWDSTLAFLVGAGSTSSMVVVQKTDNMPGTVIELGREAERVRDGRAAVNDTGTFALPLEITGDITDDDVVVTGTIGGALAVPLREGDAVSSITGASLGSSISDVGIDASGDLSVRSTTLAGPAAGADAAILLDDGAALAAQIGVTIPTGQSGTPAPWKQVTPGTFWSADDGTSWLAKGFLDTGASSDQVLVVNEAVEVREGETFGGMASPVRHIVGQNMNPAGHWYARGENADGQAWVAEDGAVPGTTEVWANSAPGLSYNLALYDESVMIRQHDLSWSAWPATVYDTSISIVEVQNGLDITVEVTNTHPTLPAPWPEFAIDLGWGTGDNPERVWWARHKFQPFDLPDPSSPEIPEGIYGMGGMQLNANCLALDDGEDGTTTVGFATDYPYVSHIVLDNWQDPTAPYRTLYIKPGGTTNEQPRVIPDWIKPGPAEKKTIRFWLRRISAVGEDAALAAVQPYVDHVRDTYPSNRPPKLHGRMMGMYVAQKEQLQSVPRQYWEFPDPNDPNNSVTPANADGWAHFLDAIVNYNAGSAQALVQQDYVGIMLWAMSGYKTAAGDDNFFPSIIRNLDTQLAATMNEIPAWESANGLGVYAWAGHAFRGYQDGGYDSTVDHYPLAAGHYSRDVPIDLDPSDPDIDPTDPDDPLYPPQQFPPLASPPSTSWSTWTLEADAITEFDANVHAAFEWFSGVGLDAMPDPVQDPWIMDELEVIRAEHPDKWFCAEAQMSDRSLSLAPNYYQGPDGNGVGPFAFEGRCPLLERIYPGYQSIVYVFRPGDQAALDADVEFIEAEGMIALTIGGMPTDPYAGPEEEPEQRDLDRYGNTFFAHFGNRHGDSIVAGFTDAGEAVWVLNSCRVVLREGDPIDLDGNGLLDDDAYVDVTGATAAGLTPLADNGFLDEDLTLYTVVNVRSSTWNALGEAFIRVPICRADFDDDGAVTTTDFALFQDAYTAGNLCADFNRNGTLDLNDFTVFNNERMAGCP